MELRQVFESNFLPGESIVKLKAELIKFSNEVNQASRKEKKPNKLPRGIADYSNAVTKSTTDKDRRLIRHKIVLDVVSKYARKKVETELAHSLG
jgi:hypothetical protein